MLAKSVQNCHWKVKIKERIHNESLPLNSIICLCKIILESLVHGHFQWILSRSLCFRWDWDVHVIFLLTPWTLSKIWFHGFMATLRLRMDETDSTGIFADVCMNVYVGAVCERECVCVCEISINVWNSPALYNVHDTYCITAYFWQASTLLTSIHYTDVGTDSSYIIQVCLCSIGESSFRHFWKSASQAAVLL
jgi:hypothetical protein